MACRACGLPGVDGTCSMCYGDPYHNTDGEYLAWLQDEEEKENERQYQESLNEEYSTELWVNDELLPDDTEVDCERDITE